jgi:hypothetical protein
LSEKDEEGDPIIVESKSLEALSVVQEDGVWESSSEDGKGEPENNLMVIDVDLSVQPATPFTLHKSAHNAAIKNKPISPLLPPSKVTKKKSKPKTRMVIP